MISLKRSMPILVAAAITLGACTSGAAGSSSEPADVNQSDVEAIVTPALTPTTAAVSPVAAVAIEPTVPEDPPAAQLADQVTNDGVLAAAVIIVSNGDLEAAIADGIVTEAEADAAIAALEAGTLSDYQD